MNFKADTTLKRQTLSKETKNVVLLQFKPNYAPT
jgi:hypothetical protein